MRTCQKSLTWFILASLAMAHAQVLQACSTPVFQYALERWQPDHYEVVILHRKPLGDEDNEIFELLRRSAGDDAAPANLSVRSIDLSQPVDPDDQKLVDAAEPSDDTPWMHVRYPAFTQTDRLAFSGPFNSEMAAALLDSPARREVVERIVAGDSAVWILIESGDPAKDDAAELVLQKRLSHLQNTLEVPKKTDAVVSELFPADESVTNRAELPLRLTLLRVSRDDPAERGFVSMLVNSEPDLVEFQEPIAIPIFGRARSHYALVGKGISDDNIDDSCQFLCGSCSCEVKVQNPGADMLVRANWENLITGTIEEQSLPTLIGLGAIDTGARRDLTTLSDQGTTETDQPPQSTPPPTTMVSEEQSEIAHRQSSLFVPVIGIFALGLLVVAVGSVWIKLRHTVSQ